MVEIIPKATRQFIEDFELVTDAYKLRKLGEYEIARQAARDDMANAIPCYAALAAELRA